MINRHYDTIGGAGGDRPPKLHCYDTNVVVSTSLGNCHFASKAAAPTLKQSCRPFPRPPSFFFWPLNHILITICLVRSHIP
ncbi:hypothetical protein Nepgr_024490 [Nepenthes gracilis]|uniref:Uncharacterized protein n=1 Tax=Nepenthes gracilis TaxID=150966 RepID=A0AAD3XYN2_NEPGR|nr:hypothetical protein Nepgr_024490 [Nepenthes gracilis]